jgi:glycerol-3-phosphate acyltransferase PlsY
MTWLLLAAAYLTGATPTSYLVGRMRGLDLRRHGSGNLGATNAFRVLGWKAATPIVVVDIFKGWFPAACFPLWDQQPQPEWALAFGTAAIVGHVFSVYVGFRGGKGVATSAGVFLALAPLAVLAALVIWAAIVFGTGYVSLASMTAALLFGPLVFLTRGPGASFWVAILLAAFIIFAHRSNIRRLLRGEEHRFRRRAAAP